MASDSWCMMLALCALALVAPHASAEDTNTTTTAKETAMSIFKSTEDITLGPSLLAIGAVAAGAVMCVAGYRLFRAAIFFCGFIVGGVAIASAIEFVFKSQEWMVTASWIGFFVGGVFFGVFTMSLYTTSLFVAGAAAGVLLAFTVHTTVAYKFNEENPNTVLVVLAVLLALLGGMLALKIEKPVLVVATSFVGAVATTWGIGYFAGKFPNGADLKHYATMDLDGNTIITIPSAWWGYLAVIVVLFLAGTYVQFHKTGKGRDYHKSSKANSVPATSQNAFSHV